MTISVAGPAGMARAIARRALAAPDRTKLVKALNTAVADPLFAGRVVIQPSLGTNFGSAIAVLSDSA
jgi:hypothetical protein